MALTSWYGGQLPANRRYEADQFLMVYMAVINESEDADTLMFARPKIVQTPAAANRTLKYLNRRKTNSKPALEVPNTDGGVKMKLQDVWFRYATRDILIFTRLDMTTEKGRFAARVGSSGCGKTSIVSLLERARFYKVPKRKRYPGMDLR
ncbi:ABC transporter transmembrane region [Diplocarpon rosae]|nr:ABC transporter transmembrane region [Diplocarpon rosae]